MTESDKQKYRTYLQQPEWTERRNEILDRDGYACKNCGSHDSLQVHHRQYHRNQLNNEILAPWEYDDENLITLCKECHSEGHQLYKIPEFNVIKTFKKQSL